MSNSDESSLLLTQIQLLKRQLENVQLPLPVVDQHNTYDHSVNYFQLFHTVFLSNNQSLNALIQLKTLLNQIKPLIEKLDVFLC